MKLAGLRFLTCYSCSQPSFSAALLPFALLLQAVMTLTGVGLFIYTLPVSALGIGVGIDYSLYILSRLKRELAEKQTEHAYATTFQTAGRAVCYTAATVTAGVLTLCLSEMRFQALLGVMLAIIMMANMISALLVLTSLLSLLKPKFLLKK